MSLTKLDGDVLITGRLIPQLIALPAQSVTDAAIAAAAGIASTKLQQQHAKTFSQGNVTSSSERRVLHVVRGATGNVLQFRAGSVVANIGAATVTVDLKKNGVSVLSAPITLNSANTALIAVAATVTTAPVVVGDVLEMVTVATAGGGTLATGVFAQLDIQEDPQ